MNLSIKEARKIKNIIAENFFGNNVEQYGNDAWKACDIPTREAINKTIEDIRKI